MMKKRKSNDKELKVFISNSESKCDECGEDLGRHAWITLRGEIRRRRAALQCAELDKEYISSFAARVRQEYPHCPKGREAVIAEHACRKYSGRVGHSAAAKDLDEQAVRLAVQAHVRHAETNYDDLLSSMVERSEARAIVHDTVAEVLEKWKSGR